MLDTIRRRTTWYLASALALATMGPVGRVPAAEADSSRGALPATLEAVLAALGTLGTRLDALTAKVDALTAALRPPSTGVSRLLFPQVISDIDAATVLTIANTGQDDADAPGQSGSCTVNVFGTGDATSSALGPFTISPGRAFNIGVSPGNLGGGIFGYAVATCDFPFAHGTYSILLNTTTLFGTALVLPPSRSADVVETLGP